MLSFLLFYPNLALVDIRNQSPKFVLADFSCNVFDVIRDSPPFLQRDFYFCALSGLLVQT